MRCSLSQVAYRRHVRSILLLCAVAVAVPAIAAQRAPGAAASSPTQIPPVPAALMGNKSAFDAAEANELPLSTQQIEELRQRALSTAIAIHAGPPPRLSSPSIAVSFAPGAPVPSVRVSPGFVTNLQFLGVDGSPWPIVSATVGNPLWFSVQQPAQKDKDAPTNVLTIGALTMSASSSLSVLLKGAPSAVSVLLLTDPKNGDATATLRMDRRSPEAKPQTMVARQVGQATPEMLSFLDGIAPRGAVVLSADGAQDGLQAWSYSERVFVRTRYDLVSPAWDSVISTPDGTHLYELSGASVLLAMVDGRVQQVVLRSSTAAAGAQ